MKKIKVGFLGYGTRALEALMEHPKYEVKYFLAPRARLCQDVYDAQEKYKDQLKMEIIEDNEMLAQRFSQIDDVKCFIMNACPIILKRNVLDNMKIFNIHPGDLRYNRGHQPQMWSVLLGEPSTKITLHAVGEQIDAGTIIKSKSISISPQDDALTVLDHAEDQIPYLLDGLYSYLIENALPEGEVQGGEYRRLMIYSDYEISLQEDSFEQIQRKIFARIMNHGAFFQYSGECIYVDKIISYEQLPKSSLSGITVKIDKEEEKVFVSSLQRKFVFHLNKIEVHHQESGEKNI